MNYKSGDIVLIDGTLLLVSNKSPFIKCTKKCYMRSRCIKRGLTCKYGGVYYLHFSSEIYSCYGFVDSKGKVKPSYRETSDGGEVRYEYYVFGSRYVPVLDEHAKCFLVPYNIKISNVIKVLDTCMPDELAEELKKKNKIENNKMEKNKIEESIQGERHLKIDVSEGYEIDKEHSTFEYIKFKKKDEFSIKTYSDLCDGKHKIPDEGIDLFYPDLSNREYGLSDTPSIYPNEQFAKRAIAMQKICNLMPYYGGFVDWSDSTSNKLYIYRYKKQIALNHTKNTYHFLAFRSVYFRDKFLKYNEDLVKDYFMLSE